MTYDQYWNDDCTLTKYYRKADEINRSRKNEELWLQGMYIYEALCDVSPILHAFAKSGTRPQPYSKKPYAITEFDIEREKVRKKEIEKLNRKKAKALFSAWASKLNVPENRKKEGEDGGNNRQFRNSNNK